MDGNEMKNLPKTTSLDELVEFFETHDMGDYAAEMPEVHFEVAIQPSMRAYLLEKSLAVRLNEAAHQHGVSPETLLNLWVQEKLFQETPFDAQPVPA